MKEPMDSGVRKPDLSALEALRRKQGLPSLVSGEDDTVQKLVFWLEEALSGWSAARIRAARNAYSGACCRSGKEEK